MMALGPILMAFLQKNNNNIDGIVAADARQTCARGADPESRLCCLASCPARGRDRKILCS
jgi:hypothetical protein